MIKLDTLEQAVAYWRKRWTVPGIVVGISRAGKTRFHADGVASLRTRWPLRPDSVFRVASISKVFTATLAMSLVDDGLLDLDVPVRSYLPDLRLADSQALETITTRHLLSHSSGLLGDFFRDFGLGDDALQNAIEQFHTIRQLTEPGELWHYCNSGFHLAGRVIAEASGTDFETAMRNRVFEPLALDRTGFYAHEMIVHPFAVGHDLVDPASNEHLVAGQYYSRNRNPAGGVLTNAADLLRFAQMHLGNGMLDGQRVISESCARSMRTAQIESGDFSDYWGIGWDIRDFEGVSVFGHGGSINGYQSQVTIVPEKDFALCVLTNSGRGRKAIDPIEKWIFEHEIGLTRPVLKVVNVPKDVLSTVAGTYRQPLAEVTVEVEGNGLRLKPRAPHPQSGEWVDYPEAFAEPVTSSRFLITEGDDAGEILNFIFKDGTHPVFLRRHGRLFDRVE